MHTHNLWGGVSKWGPRQKSLELADLCGNPFWISECLWVSTHPWKPLYRMEIVPGCPRHIMPRCKTCATHKTYFYTIKLDRLLILTKTFNGQEARSSILYQLPPNSLWSPKMVKFSMLPFPSKKEKICSSYPQHFPYANAPSLHPKSPHRRARLSTVRGSSFCSVRGVGTSLWWKGHQMKAS